MELYDKNIRDTALRYLSHHGEELSERALSYMDECEKKVYEAMNIRYAFNIFSISSFYPLTLGTNLLLDGRDISDHLEGCSYAGVFAAIRAYQAEDMAKAVIADAFSSALTEKAADAAEEAIREVMDGFFYTWRFSPGYGDLSIYCQKDILNLLDAPKKAGIYLLSNYMLSPTKSITAIIGISKNPIERKRMGCHACNMYEGCSFRLKENHCGF